MAYDANLVSEIVNRVMAEYKGEAMTDEGDVPVGVSNRHIHLSKEDLETLFGKHRLEYCKNNARPHIEAGRLEIYDNTNSMRLTRNGLFVSDDIMSDLMLL